MPLRLPMLGKNLLPASAPLLYELVFIDFIGLQCSLHLGPELLLSLLQPPHRVGTLITHTKSKRAMQAQQ